MDSDKREGVRERMVSVASTILLRGDVLHLFAATESSRDITLKLCSLILQSTEDISNSVSFSAFQGLEAMLTSWLNGSIEDKMMYRNKFNDNRALSGASPLQAKVSGYPFHFFSGILEAGIAKVGIVSNSTLSSSWLQILCHLFEYLWDHREKLVDRMIYIPPQYKCPVIRLYSYLFLYKNLRIHDDVSMNRFIQRIISYQMDLNPALGLQSSVAVMNLSDSFDLEEQQNIAYFCIKQLGRFILM